LKKSNFPKKGRKLKDRIKPEERKPDEETYPWEEANERVKKGYNVRLTEPTWVKLKYVVENTTHKSIQQFIMTYLNKAIEKELKKLLK